jgi:carbon-monoxide dehydrogenase medium subunit
LEAALRRDFTPQAVAAISVPPDMLNTDLHATNEYRAHLTLVLARRAIERALTAG